MSVTNPNKTIVPAVMNCGDTATVTIRFDAAAELTTQPADIILIMDRSGSMTADRMIFAKAAARQMIAQITAASGGTKGDTMVNGTRMGIASFASEATEDVALTQSVAALNDAIDDLVRGGFTNHKAAFQMAMQMRDPSSTNRQVAVMFTDGITTEGGDAQPAADALKAAGVEVFCIGLVTDPAPLNAWASDPDATHVAYTDETSQLDRVFQTITAEVIRAGALDARIQEMLNPDFRLVRIHTPTHGTVQPDGQQGFTWEIGDAGLDAAPTEVSVSFDIRYTGTDGGMLPVNAQIQYMDRAESTLVFPEPKIEVDCTELVIYPEPCPSPTFFLADHCQDAVNIELPAVGLTSLGRIVQADVTVRDVCPGKRVAVAVFLTEEGPNGEEYARGTKTLLIPAFTGDACRDVMLRCIRFVVPESLDATGAQDTICNQRKFQARVMANYLDTDFTCCDASTVIL